jgi:pimeloyl-ACP methyl ester carboxylesterase
MAAADTQAVGMLTTALRRRETYLGHAREALNLARAAAAYPLGLRQPGTPHACGGRTPVVLVHGYGHNHSAWVVLDRHLRHAGFTDIHTVDYNPLRRDIPALAADLKERVDAIRAASGSDKVHVVGHSLGGVILRWAGSSCAGTCKSWAATPRWTPPSPWPRRTPVRTRRWP